MGFVITGRFTNIRGHSSANVDEDDRRPLLFGRPLIVEGYFVTSGDVYKAIY